MTAASFADDMIGGGGKYAAVFHIAGMPWAVTTSTELVAALSDPSRGGTNSQKQRHTYRRLLFGQRICYGAGGASDHYPSDHVQIIPSLDPDLGKQSISYDESKGLSGGGWGVKFGRDAHGAEYSHFRSGAVAGTYDGLDVMPDPIYDSTVKTGILAADFDGQAAVVPPYNAANFWWGNDTGLYNRVHANDLADKITYVWFQSSCLALRLAAGPVAGIYSAVAYSGCLRTVREKVHTDQADDSSHMIISAPATSIVGMPAILWLIPMTVDGDIVDIDQAGSLTLGDYTLPVKFRDGPVLPNPTCNATQWKVSCGFWEDFLNVNIPCTAFDGELQGYMFHRPPAYSTNIVRPHLELCEWDGAQYVRNEVWLCAAGTSVYFEWKADIVKAVQEQLTAAVPFGDVPINDYTVSMGDMHNTTPGIVTAKQTFANGPVAWILALGLTSLDNLEDLVLGARYTPRWEVYFSALLPDAFAGYIEAGWDGYQVITDDNNTTANFPSWSKMPRRMRYYYQWNWMNKYCRTLGWDPVTDQPLPLANLKTDYWPLPYYATGAPRYRMIFKSDFDATMMAAGEGFRVGSAGHRHLLTGEIETVADNYVEVDDQNAGMMGGAVTDGLAGGVPALQVKTGGGLSTKQMVWGQPIYYWPALHDTTPEIYDADAQDNYRVRTADQVSSTSLSHLLLGILGKSTGLSVPRQNRLYHVPDVYFDNYDMRETIDMDRLDQLVALSTGGVKFALQLDGGAQNLKKLIFNVLLNLGIRQTWGYIESIRAYGMGFEPLGVVNPVKALMSGRILDDHNMGESEPKGVYGNTWLYHTVETKFNYQGDTPNFELTIPNVTGRAMLSSGSKTLKINDKIIQIANVADLNDHITGTKQILRRMNSAQPSTAGVGKTAALPLCITGGDCMLTNTTAYDLYKGARGMTRRAALITKVSTGISAKRGGVGSLDIGLNFRLAPGAKGIGPSLRLAAAQISIVGEVVTVDGCATDPANNDFASTLDTPNGLTDLAYFGCIDYNKATDTRALRACSCSSYAVIIVEENATSWDIAGAGRNVFTGRLLGSATATLTLADIASGDCRISIDADEGEFDDTVPQIIFFADWDDADLQPCQEVYGWLGDEIGMINDGAADSQGMTWI